jgi:type IV pilus assembly protein PilM
VAKAAGDVLERSIQQELEGRLPFPTSEAEVQYLEAGDVRHGDSIKREVVVLACHRPRVMQLVETVMKAGLVPVAIDAEPCALLRCYSSQLRREDDKHLCVLYVHIGATNTAVVIARGAAAVFVKYLPIGGQHLDEALARHLRMEISSAAALRRHHADRPAELQDPEIARAVAEASRPVIERWANELALCTRYFSVTFRGQMDRIVLGGGEATEALRELLAARMEMKAEVGNPLRSFPAPELPGRKTQWDVAVGLALRSSLA